jgi:hypothetical protein
MLASNQQKQSMVPVPHLSGKAGSRGDQAGGPSAVSATQEAKIWFVLLKGQRYGPCTFTALVRMAEIGVVDAETGVWCVGWAEWRTARNVPRLSKRESDDLDKDVEAREDDAEGREAHSGSEAEAHSGSEATEKAETAARPLGHSAGPKPAPPHQSKRAGRGGRVRLAILCVLAVIMITFGAGWAAISLDIIRVELMPPGAELLKQVEGMLARCTTAVGSPG